MTLGTERDEIQLGIFARMAAKFLMVNLQVRHRAARLTPPAIAPQHLLPQTLRKTSDPAANAWDLGQLSSRGLLAQASKKCLPLLSSLRDLLPARGCDTAKADICRSREGEYSHYRPSVPVKAPTRLNLELMPKAEGLTEGDWSCKVEIKRQTEQR